MPNLNLRVVYDPIGALKPDPANPRVHNNRQIRQLAKNIAKFGFSVPILVDAELKVIAGHGRLLACAELGITEVPTLCLDHLTPTQARAFALAADSSSESFARSQEARERRHPGGIYSSPNSFAFCMVSASTSLSGTSYLLA